MGEARARGTYQQRKANPKSEPPDSPRPVRIYPGQTILRALLGYRASNPLMGAPSKKQRRAAVRLAREARRAAEAQTMQPANPIPLPERDVPPLSTKNWNRD